jgi:subtilisin family serine protease
MLNSTGKFLLVGLAIISVALSLKTQSQVRSAAVSSPTPSPSPSPSPSPAPDFQLNQVVIQLKPGASIADVNSRNGTETVGQISGTSYYVVSAIASTGAGSQAQPQRERVMAVTTQTPTPTPTPAPTSTPAPTPTPTPVTDIGTEQLRDQLANDPAVQVAELNYFLDPLARPVMSFPDGQAVPGKSESDYESQRQLLGQLLGLNDAQLRSTGAGTVVAVIDTGVDRTHPALASHLWIDDRVNRDIPNDGIDNDNDGLVDDAYGWDFYNNDNDPTETAGDPATTVAGHGTFIAGLIALMAPECRIMPVRVLSPTGVSDIFTVAECIKYATDHGADVINLSCGTPRNSTVLQGSVTYARQHGVVLFAAVGNASTDLVPQYPANLTQDVQGVASIDTSSVLSSFSNYGSSVSVDAFGHFLVSTYPGGGYALWSGTSFATALASAEAALILSAYPDSGVTRTDIESTAVNIDALNPGKQGELGKGRIAPLPALQSVSTNPLANPTIDLYARLDLTNTGIQPASLGRAEIYISGSVQQFRISGYSLSPAALYSVVVDGNNLTGNGAASTVFGGFGLVYSNAPNSKSLALPPAQYPVSGIRHVEIRDDQNLAILSGDFTAVSGPTPPQELIYKELRLASIGSYAPHGIAMVQIHGAVQLLSISVEALPGSLYSVIADGVSLGTFAPRNGFVGLDNFSQRCYSFVLPPSLSPVVNINRISIQDGSGQPIDLGNFVFAGGQIGGP